MPFGVDALVIYFAATDGRLFWLYPVLATVGSLAGATVTFWVGHRAGEMGLRGLIPSTRLEQLHRRARHSGAIGLALPALLPPPFPLTPLVLTCGALRVNRTWFLSTFAAMRLVRFSFGAILAHIYGPGILRMLDSDTLRTAVVAFVGLAIVGTIASGVLLWRQSQTRPLSHA